VQSSVVVSHSPNFFFIAIKWEFFMNFIKSHIKFISMRLFVITNWIMDSFRITWISCCLRDVKKGSTINSCHTATQFFCEFLT
jgi:hypothetical protein